MDPLIEMFAADAEAGLRGIEAAAGHRLAATRPDLAHRLPIEATEALLNPLVLGALMGPGDPGVTLDQLLLGHRHPATWPEAVAVRTDVDGSADLPGLGVLRTERRLADLTLSSGIEVSEAGRPVSARLDEPLRGGCAPSVLDCTVAPPLRFVLGRALQESLAVRSARVVEDLTRAVVLLQQVQPDFFELFRHTTRRIVVFDDPSLNSLAAPQAHGAIFLDLAHGQGPIYHLEDLLHQAGHVAFQTMTMDPGSVLRVDPDLVVADESGGETRTAYVLLHAVVTERWMASGLLGCVADDLVTGIEKVEARGRLAYVLRRYLLDLVELVDAGVTSERGTALTRLLYQDLRRLTARAQPYVGGVDLTEQPYNFDLAAFLSHNPTLLERVHR